MSDKPTVQITLDKRGVLALTEAVTFCLEKWAGQGDLDQETLLLLKPFLHGCLLEFMFDGPDANKGTP